MRLLLAAIVSTAACAAELPPPTAPLQYSCGDHTLVRDGDHLAGPISMLLERHAEDADVFVSATGDRRITVPADPRRDAIERVYATDSTTHIARSQICRVRGGFSDMLVRYVDGASIEQLADEETGGDRNAAYRLVHAALLEQHARLRLDH